MSTKDEQFTGYRTNHPDDLAHFASVRNFQDFLVDKANPVVMVTLTIDGKGFLDNATFETHLTQHTNAHDEFTIIVNDTAIDDFKGQVMKNSQELLGQNITIHFHQYGSVIYTFRGIIAHICNKKNQGGGYGKLHISGYAPSIVLDGGKTCQSYENKTLPEIIKEATEEYPQESQIHIEGLINNEEKIPYTVQYNESDYQFIQRLAKRYGEFFYYNGTQFIFGSRAQKTITLYEGGDLREVEFELLLKPQKFNYLSYNSQMTRTEVKSSEQTETQYKENPFQFTAIKASEKVFAKTTDQTYGALPDEFRGDYLKDAVQREKESREQLMQVRGRSRNPHVHIGCFVKLIDINGLPMETYRVIDVTHYQGEGIYYNEFVAIPDVFVAYYYDEQALPKAEQQPARVIDNNDPEGWGRVCVQFIWQEKYQAKTPWIRVVQPHAGGGKGFYFIPEIGEEVLVDFEDQNAERPFVVGSHYNGKEYSPFHNTNNDIKAIQTRSGHKLIFTEDESILLSDKNGNTLRFDTQGKNIEISAPESISLCAGKDINLSAGNNLLMDVANVASFNILQQLLVNTPYMKQLITELFHTQAGKALINSDNQIKIEAKETNVAGMQKLLLHSDQDAVVNSKGYLDMRGEQGNKMKNKAEIYEPYVPPIGAKCLVHFRPHTGYADNPEFGFDWFRIGDTGTDGDVWFKDIVGRYGEYVPFNSESFRPNKEMYDRLISTYNRYVITWKPVEGGYPHYYFVPKLTLLKGKTAIFTLKIQIEEKPKKITFEFRDKDKALKYYFNINKREISDIRGKGSKYTLTNEFSIECKGDFDDMQTLYVLADDKVCGRIDILPNSPKIQKEINIVFKKVKTKINRHPNIGSYDKKELSLIKQILQHAYINVSISEEKDNNGEDIIVNCIESEFRTKFCEIKNGRYIITKTRGLKEYLEKKVPLNNNKIYVFFINEVAITDDGYDFFGFNTKNTNFIVVFNRNQVYEYGDYTTIIHEILHALRLPHTFANYDLDDKENTYTYKAKTTHNVMDYSLFKMFCLFYWQWKIINNKII
nr:MAG TPA: type VI secretion protein [Caudoviricetes sp.]